VANIRSMSRNAALRYKVRQQKNKVAIQGRQVAERGKPKHTPSRFTLKKTGKTTATIIDSLNKTDYPDDMTRDKAIATVTFMNEGWDKQLREEARQLEVERLQKAEKLRAQRDYQNKYMKRGRHERPSYAPFDRVAWMGKLQDEIDRQAAEVVAEQIHG
jgi:hypothetical protein